MFSRAQNIPRCGIDVPELPSLSGSVRPPALRILQAAATARVPMSQRGLRAFVPQRQVAEGGPGVPDRGLRKQERAPPPARPPRARTTSPERLRFGAPTCVLTNRRIMRAFAQSVIALGGMPTNKRKPE